MSAVEPLSKSAHLWARDAHDFYVEPEWCSRRLFQEERFDGEVVDPACGFGRIVRAAAEAGINAVGTDIVQRWPDAGLTVERGLAPSVIVSDFLGPDWGRIGPNRAWWRRPTNIASNPPFGHADDFITLALALATTKVAMLLPLTWMAGGARSRWLATTPLRRIWVLTPRPSMPPGAVIEAGMKPGGGTKDFAWFVWLRGYDGAPELRWLHRDRPQHQEA